MDAELNLDVDAPDKVADILNAAANAYQASAIELSSVWQDRHIPMIWAVIAGELDISAWKIAKIVKHRLDPRHSVARRSGWEDSDNQDENPEVAAMG